MESPKSHLCVCALAGVRGQLHRHTGVGGDVSAEARKSIVIMDRLDYVNKMKEIIDDPTKVKGKDRGLLSSFGFSI